MSNDSFVYEFQPRISILRGRGSSTEYSALIRPGRARQQHDSVRHDRRLRRYCGSHRGRSCARFPTRAAIPLGAQCASAHPARQTAHPSAAPLVARPGHGRYRPAGACRLRAGAGKRRQRLAARRGQALRAPGRRAPRRARRAFPGRRRHFRGRCAREKAHTLGTPARFSAGRCRFRWKKNKSRTEPAVGRNSSATMRRSEDLPHPLGPKSATNSPSPTVRLTLANAGTEEKSLW